MSDFLDDRHKEITNRLKELKPAVDEFNRLEAAVSALAGAIGSAAASAASTVAPSRKKRPGRPRGSSTRKKAAKAAAAVAPKVAAPAAPNVERKRPGRPKGSGKKVGRPPGKVGRPPGRPKGRGGRPKGGGKRATQALSFVQGQPGISIPELAARMGIKQNYLYRLLPGLEQEGKLEKKGRGWHPRAA